MEYITVKADCGLTIKDVLKRRMGFSTRLLRVLKREGGVYLNGKPCWLNVRVEEKDRIRIDFPQEKSHFPPQDIPLEVLFEDGDLLIINKQPGIVVHPTKGHPDHTLANALAMDMEKKGESYKIRFVNRLDMDTSGVLVVAKNAFTQQALVDQMKKGQTEKRYLALLEGRLSPLEGSVDRPIGEAPGRVGRVIDEDGYPCLTHYRVRDYYLLENQSLSRLFQAPEDAKTQPGQRDRLWERDHILSLTELLLETGRTHQIRVHMAYLGHPVLGDSLYGRKREDLIGRQALHGASFSFFHPRTGERLRVEAPLPRDMLDLILKEKGAPDPG